MLISDKWSLSCENMRMYGQVGKVMNIITGC